MIVRYPRTLLFLACAFALALKSPDALLDPQFWAEDGAVFFAQQYVSRGLPLLTPYAGYLHFIPRIIAAVWSSLPPAATPLAYNFSALLVEAAAITFVIERAAPLYPKLVVFLSIFLLPTVGDVFGTMTNIQWFTQFIIPIAVFIPAETAQGQQIVRKCAVAAVVFICSCSGPFSVLILVSLGLFAAGDLLVHRLPGSRQSFRSQLRVDWISFAGMTMGALLQVAIMLPASVSGQLKTPAQTYELPPDQIAQLGLYAHNWYVGVVNAPYTAYCFVLIVLYASISCFTFLRGFLKPEFSNVTTALFLLIGALQPILSYIKQRQHHVLSAVSHYYYFWGVISICAIAVLPRRQNNNDFRWISVVLIDSMLLLWKPQYAARPFLVDLGWDKYAARFSTTHQAIVVPLNPNWRATIPPASGH